MTDESWSHHWVCEVYGEAGESIGAVCFFAFDPCLNLRECHKRMTATRQKIWSRIQELAAAGDLTGVYLAGEISSPDEILNGRDDVDDKVVRSVLHRSAAPLPTITCPRCEAVSANPNDIREGYCGRCHDWTGTPAAVDDEAAGDG